VRLYSAPLLWLIMGVVLLASQTYARSSRFRARVSSDRLAEVQKANSQRFATVVVLVVGLFCTYAAIRTLIGGVDTWWLWFTAAATQFAVVALRRATAVKPAAGEVRPHMKMKRNHGLDGVDPAHELKSGVGGELPGEPRETSRAQEQIGDDHAWHPGSARDPELGLVGDGDRPASCEKLITPERRCHRGLAVGRL